MKWILWNYSIVNRITVLLKLSSIIWDLLPDSFIKNQILIRLFSLCASFCFSCAGPLIILHESMHFQDSACSYAVCSAWNALPPSLPFGELLLLHGPAPLSSSLEILPCILQAEPVPSCFPDALLLYLWLLALVRLWAPWGQGPCLFCFCICSPKPSHTVGT